MNAKCFRICKKAYNKKYDEIQFKFIDGVQSLIELDKKCPDTTDIGNGLRKLWNLKEQYESQLYLTFPSVFKMNDIEICFRCFNKSDVGCHDCD